MYKLYIYLYNTTQQLASELCFYTSTEVNIAMNCNITCITMGNRAFTSISVSHCCLELLPCFRNRKSSTVGAIFCINYAFNRPIARVHVSKLCQIVKTFEPLQITDAFAFKILHVCVAFLTLPIVIFEGKHCITWDTLHDSLMFCCPRRRLVLKR